MRFSTDTLAETMDDPPKWLTDVGWKFIIFTKKETETSQKNHDIKTVSE